MHYDFCTLFDRNYLFRGLALHESLQRHVGDFTLWVLCMDDIVYEVLEKMHLPALRLISLAQFEDEDLLRAKGTRTQVEYCWTCTPSLSLYLLDHVQGIESITYLDADLCFFSEPAGVHREMIAGSIGIVEHRLSKEYESFAENVGIYNVALMVFKNDRYARECLAWWRDRCNEWCYSRAEDGKYGDQKYLDDWPKRFPGVVVLKDAGVGLAPWNVRSRRLAMRDGRVFVDGQPLVFYHFHMFSIVGDGEQFRLVHSYYRLGRRGVRLVYRPYIASVKRAVTRVRQIDAAYVYGISSERPDTRFVRLGASARGLVAHIGRRMRQPVRAALGRSGSQSTSEADVSSTTSPGAPVDGIDFQGVDSPGTEGRPTKAQADESESPDQCQAGPHSQGSSAGRPEAK